ncbi:MAG: ornithine cyclodeaminase family protein [Pyrobaculum sp.]
MLLLPSIDRLVDPVEAVKAIEKAYFAKSQFLPRQSITIGDTWFAPMVGYMEEAGLAVKLVGIYPKARPTVKALVAVIDHENGVPKALINGTQLTAWRTAAASGVAALAMKTSPSVVGVVGAGTQAEYHVRVFKALFPGARFKIFDVVKERAEELAKRHGAEATSLEEVQLSDLVIAATTSKTPVVSGARLRRGAAVISIGAPRPVRELDDETKKRAGCMLVDNPHAREETDDVGDVWTYVGDFLKGASCQFGEVKVYKSVGNPLFDVAMAGYVLKKAREVGAGVEVVWE